MLIFFYLVKFDCSDYITVCKDFLKIKYLWAKQKYIQDIIFKTCVYFLYILLGIICLLYLTNKYSIEKKAEFSLSIKSIPIY